MRTEVKFGTSLTLILLLIAALSAVPEVSAPVSSNMLVRLFPSATQTERQFARGAIDLVDEPVSPANIRAWASNPAITMDGYAAIDKFQIDMNNQLWPTGPNDPLHKSPGPRNTFFNPSSIRDVAALHFRRAVAHLTNKAKYVTTFLSGYAYVMETEIPVPALEGFTDYSTLTNSTANAGDPWSPEMGGYIYYYDRAKAAAELDLGGFRDYDTDMFREWRDPGPDAVYGTGDDGPIEELPNMKFYELGRSPWIGIGRDLYKEITGLGIPKAETPGSAGLEFIRDVESTCFSRVVIQSNYNIFAGGSWALGADPDFIYDLYHSSMGQYAYALNYPGFKNHEFDSVAEKVKYTQNLGDIRFAAIQAQWVKARYVPVVELFASKGVKAYRTGWDDVINMDGYGTDNRYSFLLMNWIDGPGTSRTGPANTIVYGLSSMAPLDLNIVTSGNGWVELSVPQTAWWQLFSAKALSCIYDSLIGRSPYNMPSEVGWLATSWRTIGNYPAWSQGTVAEFTVRTDATFHDGSPVKPSDVAYSILLVRAAGFGNAWNYPSEMDVDHVEIAGNVVRVFFGVKSALTLHWAGFLPIINKDLWNQAIGVGTAAGYSGFIPDDIDGTYVPGTFASAAAMRNYHPWETTAYGDPAKIDLAEDGSGPWSFVSYMVGQSVALSAFTAYPSVVIYKDQALPIRQFVILAFHEIGNVNYEDGYGDTHDWYTHDEMIDYDDLARICTSAPSSSSWTWGPGQQQYNPDADLNKDGNVNVIDLATAGVNYGKIMG